jgi:predicted DNA-binding transcriptional regulator YafY
MIEKKTAHERYQIIDNLLSKNAKPTKEFIAKKCSVSIKAIEKDFDKMRHDNHLKFDAPIKHNPKGNTYYYADPTFSINKLAFKNEDIEALRNMMVILKRYDQFSLLKPLKVVVNKIEALQNISIESIANDLSEYIQVEIPSDSKGLENVTELYNAIKNRNTIDFIYNRFKASKVHTVDPYLIKEYKSKWYLTGFYHQENRFATFALEGIVDLKIKNFEFRIKTNFSRTDYFNHAFGITVINDYLPEKVILKFNYKQGLYIKSQPIHNTQQIIKDTKNELIISIIVIPTYELTSQILSYGNDVEVIEPSILREDIKDTLAKSCANYE